MRTAAGEFRGRPGAAELSAQMRRAEIGCYGDLSHTIAAMATKPPPFMRTMLFANHYENTGSRYFEIASSLLPFLNA
jgi:hypothetical protein